MNCPVGELGDLCARVRSVERWWRSSESVAIREYLEEAAALPERQAEAREELREAEDALAKLKPDGTASTLERWRDLQRTVTRARKALNELAGAAAALYAALGIELWWARTAHWREGVEAANAGQG